MCRFGLLPLVDDLTIKIKSQPEGFLYDESNRDENQMLICHGWDGQKLSLCSRMLEGPLTNQLLPLAGKIRSQQCHLYSYSAFIDVGPVLMKC